MADPTFAETTPIEASPPKFEETTDVFVQNPAFEDSLAVNAPTFDETFSLRGESDKSGKFEQVKEIPRSIYAGLGDSFYGVVGGAHRAGEQIARKFESENRREFDNIIAKGGDPEGWRAQAFDTLANFHGNAAEWWGGETGAAEVDVARKAFEDKNAPLTQGIITDVARGLGGVVGDLVPAALSGGATLALTAPSRMFDEGYRDSIAEGKTGQEALDTATAYAFLASPLEVVADLLILKGKGRATKIALLPILKQVSTKMGLNFVSEGSTEVLQDAILNKLNGRKMFTPESMRTFVVSGLVGTIAGGGSQVGSIAKQQRMVTGFERSGMSNEDAITAANLILDGKVDEAIQFSNEKVNLRSAIESTISIDEQNNPLSEKDKKRLEVLRAKEILTEEEQAELGAITLPLDEGEIDTIYDNQGKTEVRMFAERVAIGETLTSPSDLQFQQNNAQEIESELQKIQKEQEAQDAIDTKRDTQVKTVEEGQEAVVSDTGRDADEATDQQVAGQEQDGSRVVVEPSQATIQEVGKFFDPESIKAINENKDGRQRIIYIPIDEFLKLSKKLDSPDPKKIKTINSSLDAGKKIKFIPELFIEVSEDGSSEIVDHDGRHRAIALKERGLKTIPVIIEAGVGKRFLWDRNGGFDELSNLDKFPTTLKTERGEIIPFPLNRDGNQTQETPVQADQAQDVSEAVVAEQVAPAASETVLDAPETERMVEGSDSVGISIDRMNVRLEELGSTLLEDVDVKALQTSMDNAIANGDVDTIEKLAMQSLIKGDVQFNDEQVMAAGARLAQLQNEIEIFEDSLDTAEDAIDIDAIKVELSNRTNRANNLMFGLRGAVTDSARAVRAMGSIINRQDYSVSSMIHQAIMSKGEPLTPQEEKEVTEKARDVRKAQKVVTDKDKVEKKQNLQQKIDDLTENIRFMKRNIENRKGKKSQTNDQKRLTELKRIERQQDTIAELLTVLRNERTNATQKKLIDDPEGYIDTISNLRTEIRDSAWYKNLQREAKKDELKQSQLDALNEKLDSLESQLAGKFRNIPEGKDVTVADADIKALRDAIDEVANLMRVEDQIADLDEQIRTGIFRETEKKVAKKQSKALVDAKTLLHQRQREAREKIYSLRDETLRDKFKNWATLPRSLMATADMSYGLRQGLLPAFAHPRIASRTWGKAFQATFSQNTADEIDVAMREDPLFDEMVKFGAHFSSMDSAISNRTEFFASNLAEQIPGFGKVVQASERNMVTGINMLRYGLIKDFLANHPDAPIEAKEAYAKYINVATGRGEAKFLDKSAEELSLLFFAPRFAFSRVQAPFLAASNLQHPELREEMVKQWVAYLGTGMTVLALAKAAGAEVEDDPEDSDWGKIVFGGNKRIDIWGGIQQPMRLLAKTIKGGGQQIIEGETDINPIEDMWRFLSYKLSPPVQMLNELISGQDIIGRETEPFEIPDIVPFVGGVEIPTPATVAVRNLSPLVIQSAVEAWREGENLPMVGALMLGEGLGLSIGVYDKK